MSNLAKASWNASLKKESWIVESKLKSSQSFIISFDLGGISTPENNLALTNANLVARNGAKGLSQILKNSISLTNLLIN